MPQATTTTFALSSNARDLTPTMGGPTQRVAFMGDRWNMTFKCRPLIYNQATGVLAQLVQGLNSKVRAYIPQPFINTQAGTGITFANASAAVGQAVALTGFNHGYVVQQGQFFNISTNGVEYLYYTTSSVTADSNGHATVSFLPTLKAPPNSGDAVTFAAPVIEGFLSGNQQSWDLSLVQSVGFTYTVREAQ